MEVFSLTPPPPPPMAPLDILVVLRTFLKKTLAFETSPLEFPITFLVWIFF